MSSNLFPYKYSMEEWYKADTINESDVVVIVDTSREIIWFYSGKKSTARNRSKARGLLTDLMKNYSSYSLKNVAEEAPDDILIELENLKEEYFKRRFSTLTYDLRKVSNTFFYLSCLASLLLIMFSSFSFLIIFGSTTSFINGYTHFVVSMQNYSFQILFISLILLTSFICFIIMFLIVFFLMKKKLILYTLIAIILTFLGFFLIRTWDFIIFFETVGQSIFFRIDVFIMFMVNLNIIGMIPLIIGIFLIMNGPKIILEFP
ncbi:MAG: hypothetical protein ACFFKA_08755 [Candidatus Thorarchaeota archaeon]